MGEKPTWAGEVVALYIAPTAEGAGQAVHEARLLEGRGIEGDRHFLNSGQVTSDEEESYQVTLIESESVESVESEAKGKITVDVSLIRRNIVTRGFSVSHLVGREFQVGAARLRGISLYEPTSQLMDSVGHKIAIGLMHRGGLIAEIISSGVVHVGDSIHA